MLLAFSTGRVFERFTLFGGGGGGGGGYQFAVHFDRKEE